MPPSISSKALFAARSTDPQRTQHASDAADLLHLRSHRPKIFHLLLIDATMPTMGTYWYLSVCGLVVLIAIYVVLKKKGKA